MPTWGTILWTPPSRCQCWKVLPGVGGVGVVAGKVEVVGLPVAFDRLHQDRMLVYVGIGERLDPGHVAGIAAHMVASPASRQKIPVFPLGRAGLFPRDDVFEQRHEVVADPVDLLMLDELFENRVTIYPKLVQLVVDVTGFRHSPVLP